MVDVSRDRELERKQQRAERKRKRRYARNQRFADKAAFHGIHWEYYSHKLLYRMIHSAQPQDMLNKVDGWAKLSTAIQQTNEGVEKTVSRLLQTWRGPAAERALASTMDLSRWASQASDIASRIGTGLSNYTEAVIQAQHHMPPPVDKGSFLSGFHAGGATVPNAAAVIMELTTDQKANEQQAKDAKAEAVRVMRSYGQESQQVHDTMPWFYDAPPAQWGPPDDIPERDPRPEPPPEKPREPVTGPVTGPEGSGVAGDIDGDGVSDTTAPEGYTPTPGPGPSGGGYATGFGVPSGGGGGDLARGGGGFGPGGPGAGGLSGVGAPGAAARAGMPGMGGPGAGPGGSGGFFPPMGAGAGAGREEDKDHKNKYDDGLDLLDDLPPHFPPVFGV